jgi:hypothetical protein
VDGKGRKGEKEENGGVKVGIVLNWRDAREVSDMKCFGWVSCCLELRKSQQRELRGILYSRGWFLRCNSIKITQR